MSLALLAGGRTYPPVLSTAEAAEILDVAAETVRRRCVQGRLPLLSRARLEPWRIPTCRLFDELGLAYETITSAPTQQSAPNTAGTDAAELGDPTGRSSATSSPRGRRSRLSNDVGPASGKSAARKAS